MESGNSAYFPPFNMFIRSPIIASMILVCLPSQFSSQFFFDTGDFSVQAMGSLSAIV
jgi:hypothetical protein